MNIEAFREYCLSKPGVAEDRPFDESTLVFKVMGKIFALTSLDSFPFRVNLKCEPEKAIQLRESYPGVQPGYHMNKVHWNTVRVGGLVGERELRAWIDDSYQLVAAKLTKAQQQSLEGCQ
ncbi:MAG: MmcQ/YjbR family DNA-binding protein [Ferruginibacter sp.]|nr:MmcQ/YjbR family DNA-binding protein [Cytophagales bacterium]